MSGAAADKPITDEEMAAMIRRILKAGFGVDLTDGPPGDSFRLLTLATEQEFRVTVSEVKP